MAFGSRRMVLRVIGTVAACLLGTVIATGQAGQAQRPPMAEEVFEKYIQAIGGAQRLARVTRFLAKGTYSGYDTDQAKVPVEIFAKAPAQRTTIVHALFGDSVRTFDGRAGWIASADKPMPLMPL